MSSRRSFLDSDTSIMERNLRFVKNDLEENLHQYFGGSSGRDNNSPHYSAPPRDYKVVQPKPADPYDRASLDEVEKRRRFLLQLGFSRHVAYDFAKSSYINIDRLRRNYNEYLDKGFSQDKIMERILCDIRYPIKSMDDSHNEQDMLRKTPSPPPPPIISMYGEDQDNLHYDSRSYSDRANHLQPCVRQSSRKQPSEITHFSNYPLNSCHGIKSDKTIPNEEYNSEIINLFLDFQPSTSKACMKSSPQMSSRKCGSNDSVFSTQPCRISKKDNSRCPVEVVNASVQNPNQISSTGAHISDIENNSTHEMRSLKENITKKPDLELSKSLQCIFDYLAEAETKSNYHKSKRSKKDLKKLRKAANTVSILSKRSDKELDEKDFEEFTWAKNFLKGWQDIVKRNEERMNLKRKLVDENPAEYYSRNNLVEAAPLIRAIIDRNDPDGAISEENWNIMVNQLIRKFRKLVMGNPGTLIQCSDGGWHKQGLVRLVSCPNELSVVYLEQTIRVMKGLSKAVNLDVVNIDSIPRRPRASATVLSEPSDGNEILKLLQLGNPDIPTQDWKIVSVGVRKKSFRQITVTINEPSLRILSKHCFKLYYGFETIRLKVSKNMLDVTQSSTSQGRNIQNVDCKDDPWEPVNQTPTSFKTAKILNK